MQGGTFYSASPSGTSFYSYIYFVFIFSRFCFLTFFEFLLPFFNGWFVYLTVRSSNQVIICTMHFPKKFNWGRNVVWEIKTAINPAFLTNRKIDWIAWEEKKEWNEWRRNGLNRMKSISFQIQWIKTTNKDDYRRP